MHACILEHSGTFWNFNSMHACMHAFWNILELSGTLTPCMHACMHSGTFCMHYGTFCMHSGTFWNFLHASWNILNTFWNILHAFWNILYAFWNLLEPSGTFWDHSNTNCPQTDRQTDTDIRT